MRYHCHKGSLGHDWDMEISDQRVVRQWIALTVLTISLSQPMVIFPQDHVAVNLEEEENLQAK